MRTRIEIDTRTFVRFWLVVVGFALLALVIYSARTALTIIGISLFLALALSTPVNFLVKKLPGKSRVLSTALSYVAIVLALGAFVFLAVPPIIEQTVKLAQTVPALVDTATEQYGGINVLIERYNLQPQVDEIVGSVKDSAGQLATGIGTSVITGISSVFAAVAASLLVLFLAFFMLVEGPAWLKRLWDFYHDKELMRYHRSVMDRMHKVVTGYVMGQLSIAGMGALISGVVVFILSIAFDVPTNLAIPTVAVVFVLSLIPLFGSTMANVLISILLALNDVTAALIFIVFFIVYQQIENNYISPKIQSRKLNLSPLAILLAITIGIYLFGIIGGIISIPIAGCAKVLYEDYIMRRQRKHELANSA